MVKKINLKKTNINIYDIVLKILVVIALIVLVAICIKYGKNKVNEKNLKEVISHIETKDFETIDEINGYKIVGIIEIPKIGIKYPILSETNKESMKISITKFWGNQINSIGNVTLAGHNNRDGTMFGKTKKLQEGDIINLTGVDKKTVSYKIFKTYIIEPNDVSCVKSVEPGTREITLITCTNGNKNRLVTKAREI